MTSFISALLLGVCFLSRTINGLLGSTNEVVALASLPSVTPSQYYQNYIVLKGSPLQANAASQPTSKTIDSPHTAHHPAYPSDSTPPIDHDTSAHKHDIPHPSINETIAFEQRAVVSGGAQHPFIEQATAANEAVQCKANQFALHSKMYRNQCVMWAPGAIYVRIYWGTGRNAAKRLEMYSSGDCSGKPVETRGKWVDCLFRGDADSETTRREEWHP